MLPSKPLPLFIDNLKESSHIQHAIFILVWGKIYGNTKLTPSSAWTNYAFELVIYQFHTLTYGVWWSDLLWSLGNDTQWLKKTHLDFTEKKPIHDLGWLRVHELIPMMTMIIFISVSLNTYWGAPTQNLKINEIGQFIHSLVLYKELLPLIVHN